MDVLCPWILVLGQIGQAFMAAVDFSDCFPPAHRHSCVAIKMCIKHTTRCHVNRLNPRPTM